MARSSPRGNGDGWAPVLEPCVECSSEGYMTAASTACQSSAEEADDLLGMVWDSDSEAGGSEEIGWWGDWVVEAVEGDDMWGHIVEDGDIGAALARSTRGRSLCALPPPCFSWDGHQHAIPLCLGMLHCNDHCIQ